MFGLNKLFKKKIEVVTTKEQVVEKSQIEKEYEWLLEKNYIDKYNITNTNILIMDDKEDVIESILDDLYSLDLENPNFNIENFNIIKISGNTAAFKVFEMLEHIPNIQIDFCLLDIVLGGIRTNEKGKRVMYDGVDVAIKLMKRNYSINVLFFSGCAIDIDAFNFRQKFEDFTGEDMTDYLLAKGESFEVEIEKLNKFFTIY